MLNVICCFYLAFVSQKPPTSRIVKVGWHCRLLYLFFNLFYYFSLLYVRLLNSLSFLILSPSLSLSKLLSTLTLSLCVGGWASTPVCGSWVSGSMDRQVWSSRFYGVCGFGVLGSVGFLLLLLLLLLLWPVLKGRGGYG